MADGNGDGYLDLMEISRDGTTTVLNGDGNGSFDANSLSGVVPNAPAGIIPSSIIAFPLDNSPGLSLAVTDEAGNTVYFFGG